MPSRGVWRAVLAVWAGSTALALLFAAGNSLTYLSTGRSGSWRLTISLTLAEWWLWALLTPAVAWLARRWPVRTPHLVGAIAVHAAAGLVIAFFKASADRLVRGAITGSSPYFLISTVTFQFVLYCAVVAAVHGIDAHRRGRSRELEASRLETVLADARLELLRSQLQPHFLFNTLNAIAELIHEDPHAAEQMITRLGVLLREAIGGSQEVPVAAELELLRCYVAIQQTRFGDRLDVRVDADPLVMKARMPGFLLQPIVENAIRHGRAGMSGAGVVRVTLRRDVDRLIVVVADDGAGFEGGAPTEGIGLKNTRARLQALYGSGCALDLGNASGGGARVLIALPFRDAGGSAGPAEAS